MRKFLFESDDIEGLQKDDADSPFAFLGGTIAGSQWREELMSYLRIGFFNPVVENWTEEDARREDQAKSACAILVYVITPKQKGFYGVVEVVHSVLTSNRPVAIAFLAEDAGETFDDHQTKSIKAIINLLSFYSNAHIFETLEMLANYLNTTLEKQGE